MKIQPPEDVRVTSDLRAILADVDEELQRLRAMGEFSPEVKDEISRTFLPERISDTLNLEGIRVNPRLTRAILEGLSLSETDKYNEREVLNVIEANDLIETLAHSAESLTPSVVREIHRRVTEELVKEPGAYRQEDIEITGASFKPPSWAEVSDLISELCDNFESFRKDYSGEHPIVAACWLHASFTAIHPFVDGNGRVGRLLQDYALLRGALLPVGIPVGRRQEYYDALMSADDGDWKSLIAIVAGSELTALDRARRIAEAPAKRRERIKSLLRPATIAKKQREYNLYEVWRRRVDGIREEFDRWAQELNDEAELVAIRSKAWDPISFEKWTEIKERGWAPGTWVFTLTFVVERRRIYSCLFYAHRHEDSFTLDYERNLFNAVGIFMTGAEEGEGTFEFGKFQDPYIRLRELVYNDEGALIAYRDPVAMRTKVSELPEGIEVSLEAEDRWLPSKSDALPDVIEEFLTDMLVKLGLSG